jgi:hypothetical protein
MTIATGSIAGNGIARSGIRAAIVVARASGSVSAEVEGNKS